jgi:hypothetical protein
MIAQVKDNNRAYLAAFVANHVDPSTLQPAFLHGATQGPDSLAAAVGSAKLVAGGIVRGRVRDVQFRENPDRPGEIPLAYATVIVERVFLSPAGGLHQDGATITILQLGGPTWQAGADLVRGTGGNLAQLHEDPILLPGQEVVLFLSAVRDTRYTSRGTWLDLGGTNLVIRAGLIEAAHGVRFRDEVTGKTPTELDSAIQGLALS